MKVPLCPPPATGAAFISEEAKFNQLTVVRIDLNVPGASCLKYILPEQSFLLSGPCHVVVADQRPAMP